VTRRHGSLLPTAAGLAAYALAASWAAWTYRDWINPDAVSYLRNALYWSQGRFGDAVAGYWSPLFSLCLAPLVAMGFDPAHAGIAVMAVWGAALVVATGVLVIRLRLLPAGPALAASLLVAETTVRWGTTLFPDVILAACLMGSAVVLVDPAVLTSRRRAMLAGVLGGLSYLGKAYGFPFFLVFLPMTLACFHAPPWRAVVRAWGLAMAGFAMVAIPWAAALSIKYETPTIGLVGRINHAIVGPWDPSRNELWKPVPGRITVWEIPETRRYGFWSPLDSVTAFRWQVRLVWTHAKQVRDALARFDWLSLGLVLAVVGPFLAHLGDDRLWRRFVLWIAGTFAVFGAGFVFVYFDYRYVAPFLKPLAIMATFACADRLASRGVVRVIFVSAVILSFAAHANVPFTPYLVEEPHGTAFDNITVDSKPHRVLAHRLAEAGVSGPLASNFYWGGMFTSYFMDAAFVGSPAGNDADAVNAELRSVGARAFLVDPAWPLAPAFERDPAWSLAMETESAGQRIEVFVRR